MVQEIHSFDAYIDFINEISENPQYADPHFLCDRENLFGALQKKDQKAYIVSRHGKTKGLFVWLFCTDEKYIEMMIGLTASKEVFSEMLNFIFEQYRGCKIDFVVNPDNHVICEHLREIGAAFAKEQQRMVYKQEVPFDSTLQVELLSEKWEKPYCALHHLDTYWTAEKILAAKDRFRTFIAIADQQIIGYIDVTYCFEENEPYDLYVKEEYRHKGYEIALLKEALKYNKPNRMMALVDVDSEDEITIFSAAGFEAIEGQNSIYASYRS